MHQKGLIFDVPHDLQCQSFDRSGKLQKKKTKRRKIFAKFNRNAYLSDRIHNPPLQLLGGGSNPLLFHRLVEVKRRWSCRDRKIPPFRCEAVHRRGGAPRYRQTRLCTRPPPTRRRLDTNATAERGTSSFLHQQG